MMEVQDDPPRKIVIICDEPVMIDLIKLSLENRPFEIISATSGVEGLELIEKERPDLVIVDLVMPGLSGLDVLLQMKDGDITKDIPVILMAPKSQNIDKISGLHIANLDVYILTKPFSPRDFLRAIRYRLGAIINVYVERSHQRAFVGAIDWPGWRRSGRDEESALQALLEYGTRYADALAASDIAFTPPDDISAFQIVQRLTGDITGDDDAPGEIPMTDTAPFDGQSLARCEAILRACWRTFDAAVEATGNRGLRKGPRGEDRELHQIIQHVFEHDRSDLRKLLSRTFNGGGDAMKDMAPLRDVILEELAVRAQGDDAENDPRSGKRWRARYFVRRSAWRALDRAWEIEDRIEY